MGRPAGPRRITPIRGGGGAPGGIRRWGCNTDDGGRRWAGGRGVGRGIIGQEGGLLGGHGGEGAVKESGSDEMGLLCGWPDNGSVGPCRSSVEFIVEPRRSQRQWYW